MRMTATNTGIGVQPRPIAKAVLVLYSPYLGALLRAALQVSASCRDLLLLFSFSFMLVFLSAGTRASYSFRRKISSSASSKSPAQRRLRLGANAANLGHVHAWCDCSRVKRERKCNCAIKTDGASTAAPGRARWCSRAGQTGSKPVF
jgi:hypothetical protein